MDEITLRCDGLCEPTNPGGWACYGWVAYDSAGHELGRDKACIGHGAGMTNNLAEYHAIGHALKWAYGQGHRLIKVQSDSQLAINQLKGEWRCNQPHLLKLRDRIWQRINEHDAAVTFGWIPRELNTAADLLSRQAYYTATATTDTPERAAARR